MPRSSVKKNIFHSLHTSLLIQSIFAPLLSLWLEHVSSIHRTYENYSQTQFRENHLIDFSKKDSSHHSYLLACK